MHIKVCVRLLAIPCMLNKTYTGASATSCDMQSEWLGGCEVVANREQLMCCSACVLNVIRTAAIIAVVVVGFA